jgi:hypothetical protein
MRRTVMALGMIVAASPLLAQARQQAVSDPTRKVAGGNVPAGWEIRLDDKDTGRYTTNDTKFVAMGPGYHVTSGPAALYYNPKDAQPNAPYVVSATFTQTKAPTHPEAYGVFIGGQNLPESSEQTYVYFLVRGNGQYLINHRAGTEVHKIVNWTPSAAVKQQDEAGKATNEVAIAVGADSVRFLVNGQAVHAISRQEITDVSGDVGLRVNHNLDVHVANFGVKKGSK